MPDPVKNKSSDQKAQSLPDIPEHDPEHQRVGKRNKYGLDPSPGMPEVRTFPQTSQTA